jgi:hypothetical protein
MSLQSSFLDQVRSKKLHSWTLSLGALLGHPIPIRWQHNDMLPSVMREHNKMGGILGEFL